VDWCPAVTAAHNAQTDDLFLREARRAYNQFYQFTKQPVNRTTAEAFYNGAPTLVTVMDRCREYGAAELARQLCRRYSGYVQRTSDFEDREAKHKGLRGLERLVA
jgi:hypothetical protein